ncbi:phage tail assembly protein T [Stieleria magnilauensis]|uniref:Minor tail T domain-containing protein n=1 Tax=Stieleria magnilauensis TaxID=2527963 RepID=A0ABX5XY90_9BACT|nr:hypothetical protein TBK1r_59420 [Planctomycetes bacterium TBK1r]QDV86993.1 hypothetical protein TBK1r_60200 [Planctomycetes bacterium TBK1r]
MLACRLCLALGIDDPEAWLDSASERQLALWQAFYRIEPWGAEFHRSATQASLASAAISMAAAANGQKIEIQEFGSFMPSDWIGESKRKKRTKQAVNQSVKALSGMFPTADKIRVK